MLLAVAVADVPREHRLAIEAEALEHLDRALLLGDDLDHELPQVEFAGELERLPDELRAQAFTTPARIHDHVQLGDVPRPPHPGDDRRIAADGPVVGDRDQTAHASARGPTLDGATLEHVLLEEALIGLGDALEERARRVLFALLEPADHHVKSSLSVVGRRALRPPTRSIEDLGRHCAPVPGRVWWTGQREARRHDRFRRRPRLPAHRLDEPVRAPGRLALAGLLVGPGAR